MIRLTHVPAKDSSQRKQPIVMIPGGPGLSSRTLAPLTALNARHDLYMVDLPGVDGVPFLPGVTFNGLCEEIAQEIAAISGNVVLLGHSFGGFFATRMALQNPSVSGLICLSVPFGKATLTRSSENYNRGMSPALQQAVAAWSAKPSRETFNQWFAACGPLYFAQAENGARVLGTDPSGFELYQALRKDADTMEPLLSELAEWNGKSLFLAGEDDPLFMHPLLEEEAKRAKGIFHAVERAKHFLFHDQPETVVRLIEDFLSTEER